VSLVGLFGGSFDPIHHGHLITAAVVGETLGLDQLRFVPANEQPFKAGTHQASAVHRAAMLQLAVAGRDGFAVERAELERPGPSYTVETLRMLTAREPGTRFVVLLGADAAAQFDRWREPDEIRRLAQVAVFARPGAPAATGRAPGPVVEVPGIGISATDVRRRVAEGRSVRYWVPDAVADYIAMHRLYLSHV
jgi:nicotinate-nucleotide adenylyltransferase